MNHNPVITGTGSYVPEKVLTNKDLEKKVDTSDEWIRTRSGIEERRIAADDQAASDLGAKAARKALEDAEITPDAIDLIIVATCTPDMAFPSTACRLQEKIGISSSAAVDISAACSGFIYALSMAHSQVMAGVAENVLVVASEVLSRYLNWEDRTTCVLFGDGAGSVVVSNRPGVETGSIDSVYIKANGEYGDILTLPGCGSERNFKPDAPDEVRQLLAMDGRAVYKVAVRKMRSAALRAVRRAGISPDDIDAVICHQANKRIIDAVRSRLEQPEEKMIINLQKYGNTSAASIPLALDEARAAGKINPGDKLLFVAFGGGLTWGSTVVTMPED
ncbi:MAG: beta-ketoacyl-ACP synthase III [bacterium]